MSALPLNLFIEKLKTSLLSLAPRLNELILQSSTIVQTTLVENQLEENVEAIDNKIIDLINEENKDFTYLSMDSSSRSIYFRGIRFFISTVVISTPNGLVSLPSTFVDKPFIAIKSYLNVLEELEKIIENYNLPILTKSPAGYFYVEDSRNPYKDDNINDELRLLLENFALDIMTNYESDYVLVDGPVIPTPPILFLWDNKNSKYYEAFSKLLIEENGRVKKVRRFNVPVVGFVKRCDDSRKLIMCNEIKDELNKLGLNISHNAPDTVIVDLLASKFYKEKIKPGRRAIVLGPFEADYRSILPNKVFWYIWIPTLSGPIIYRFEVIKSHFEKYGDLIEDIIKSILFEVDYNGVPVKIRLVDYFARRLASSLYRRIAHELSTFLVLTYDERLRLAEIERELQEEVI